MMSCLYFQAIWERTVLTAKEVSYFHGSQVGSPRGNNPIGTEGPQFVRVAFFLEREPLRGVACRCGASSAWSCWNRTKADELLGGARR
jgi:hypothetical protein